MAGAWTTKSINFNGTTLSMRCWDESGTGAGPFSFGQVISVGDGTHNETFGAGATDAGTQRVVLANDSVNGNISDGSGQTTSTHAGSPVVGLDPYSQYETVAASQNDQVMGATGAQYDYIAGVLIIPATAAAGAVSIKDGNGSSITIFAGGGTTALADLKPFLVPLGLHALAGTSSGWKITTALNVSAIGIGKFT